MDDIAPAHLAARPPAYSAVALIGFMGAGKTTVGRELAARIGWRFLDLDLLIEEREQRTIAHIFRQDGEAAFRRIELALLRELIEPVKRGHAVLALGGGAFAQPGVQRCLEAASIPAVFLDAAAAELFRRCEETRVDRPLRRNARQFSDLLEQRRPEYLKAALRVDTSAKLVGEVVQEIISRLDLVPVSGACD
jgi:shikimate kinase